MYNQYPQLGLLPGWYNSLGSNVMCVWAVKEQMAQEFGKF